MSKYHNKGGYNLTLNYRVALYYCHVSLGSCDGGYKTVAGIGKEDLEMSAQIIR